MSKVLLASTMAIGGASGAVGIAHLAGAFGNTTANAQVDDTGALESDTINGGVNSVDYYELPEKIDEFKSKNINEIGCIRDMFPSISGGTAKEVLEKGSDMGDSESIQFTIDTGKSCLVVNGDKGKPSEIEDTKGRGNFRFLGAFSKGSRGWVIYNYADTLAENNKKGKAKVDGGAYILKKEGSAWTSEKKLEVSNKELNEGAGTDGSLPKPGTSLPGVKNNSFWGLFDGNLDETKLCEESVCSTKNGSFRGRGSGEEDRNNQSDDVGSGSSTLSTGWNAIYGTNKGDVNIYVSNFKGEGTKVGS